MLTVESLGQGTRSLIVLSRRCVNHTELMLSSLVITRCMNFRIVGQATKLWGEPHLRYPLW